uniref:Putative sodium channel toxin Ts37 n=1 Tax=Tityus serrulatus TaxID=6887 RepID=SCX37_TITSE|nr:RecName: Full=Putative sodium channel toxin Ts37; AltName: Full=Tityustoxin-37; Flags: Precursor [Tityus serrulatus]QPD99028.1 putative sodium channel toxin Ts37 [Tityus serrulatus]
MAGEWACLLVSLVLLWGAAGSRDGFLLDRNFCRIKCSFLGSNSMCADRCTVLGASAGHCNNYACFCTDLRDRVKIWGDSVRCRKP